MELVYPLDLPGPTSAPFQYPEGRLTTAIPGARADRTIDFDQGGSQVVNFIFTTAQSERFLAWLDDDLLNAGAWFKAKWTFPFEGTAIVRFVGEPTFPTYYARFGWVVSANIEVRGLGTTSVAIGSGGGGLWSLTGHGPHVNLSDGNSVADATYANELAKGDLAMVAGEKWYWEIDPVAMFDPHGLIGIVKSDANSSASMESDGSLTYRSAGTVQGASAATAWGTTDRISFTLDCTGSPYVANVYVNNAFSFTRNITAYGPGYVPSVGQNYGLSPGYTFQFKLCSTEATCLYAPPAGFAYYGPP